MWCPACEYGFSYARSYAGGRRMVGRAPAVRGAAGGAVGAGASHVRVDIDTVARVMRLEVEGADAGPFPLGPAGDAPLPPLRPVIAFGPSPAIVTLLRAATMARPLPPVGPGDGPALWGGEVVRVEGGVNQYGAVNQGGVLRVSFAVRAAAGLPLDVRALGCVCAWGNVCDVM